MKDHSPSTMTAEKLRKLIAALVVVVTGPLIAVLVIIQLYNGVISVKGGDVTRHADPFSFYLLNGILGCIGIIALTISVATGKHLLHRTMKRSKTRKG